MKRHGSSDDSMGALNLMSICPNSEIEQSPRNCSHHVYDPEFHSMINGFDELEGCVEDQSGYNNNHHRDFGEKKRRLSIEQVKALEKNFEVENKLEPERKVKLARELGLQPRQVAVWFQNRRARWKTKQLERDYGVLKANYESLKQSYQTLQHDNQTLLKEIRELKAKLQEDKTESNISVEEEEIIVPAADSHRNVLIEQAKTKPETEDFSLPPATESKLDFNYESFNNNGGGEREGGGQMEVSFFKDGSSDSDSSAILNEDYSPAAAIRNQNHQFTAATSSAAIKFNCSSNTTLNYFNFQKPYQTQIQMYPKMEEHNFFSGEEACNFFSDEQAPTLQWWN